MWDYLANGGVAVTVLARQRSHCTHEAYRKKPPNVIRWVAFLIKVTGDGIDRIIDGYCADFITALLRRKKSTAR